MSYCQYYWQSRIPIALNRRLMGAQGNFWRYTSVLATAN